MTNQEKKAWLTVGIIVITFLLHGAIITIYGIDSDTVAIYGLGYPAVAIAGYKYTRGDRAVFDERDKEIAHRAQQTSLRATFVLSVLGMLGARYWFGSEMFVSLGGLVYLLLPLGFFVTLLNHATILVLHRTY